MRLSSQSHFRNGCLVSLSQGFRRLWYRRCFPWQTDDRELQARPPGIRALIIFFLAGTLLSFLAGVSLLVPSAFFDAMWRVNPRGHDGLVRIGLWAVALLFAASISCAAAATGLWRRTRWGHGIAVALIAINLLSDFANAVVGTEPKAIVGVPIAFALLLYLLRKRVRDFFKPSS